MRRERKEELGRIVKRAAGEVSNKLGWERLEIKAMKRLEPTESMRQLPLSNPTMDIHKSREED